MKIRTVCPLLLAFANSCSPIMGRTRFQKMIFLLQAKQAGTNARTDFNFVPYDYGPYSKALQLDVNRLIEHDLLEEEPTKGPSGKYMYRYRITEKGKMLVDRLLTEPAYREHQFEAILRRLEEIKSDINGKDLDALLREIYARYPEYAQLSKYKF
ncbi:MAG: hypothetical protein IS632_02745 [Thaumarchaeota archaeon]|nr:hypothetical protein [Nitrososphaerota archaeon]